MKEITDNCQTQSEAKAENASNTLIVCGLSVGALGAGAAFLSGAVCPLCLVATPALLGGGIVMKLKERYKKERL